MKKTLFVVSHFGSGSDKLIHCLNDNPRVQTFDTQITYNHPSSLNVLHSHTHKLDNSSAIYGEHLLENVYFSCKNLFSYCKFIYVVREPKLSISQIMAQNTYSLPTACNYYCFRLRRICEMARQTPKAVISTYQTLASDDKLKEIENYLNLSSPLKWPAETDDKALDIPLSLLSTVEESYERHLYYLKNLVSQKI